MLINVLHFDKKQEYIFFYIIIKHKPILITRDLLFKLRENTIHPSFFPACEDILALPGAIRLCLKWPMAQLINCINCTFVCWLAMPKYKGVKQYLWFIWLVHSKMSQIEVLLKLEIFGKLYCEPIKILHDVILKHYFIV